MSPSDTTSHPPPSSKHPLNVAARFEYYELVFLFFNIIYPLRSHFDSKRFYLYVIQEEYILRKNFEIEFLDILIR